MDDREGGAVWATFCMMQALIEKLENEDVLSRDDTLDLVGNAEEGLATLSPEMMSPAAREIAKVLLQQFGKLRS